MLVKVNPADVVSIPSDYNNAKGRAWKYEVVGEMNATEWRKMLANADFTAASVVSPTAQPTVVITHAPKVFPSVEVVFHENFYVDDDGEVRWFDTDNKAKIDHVISRVAMRVPNTIRRQISSLQFKLTLQQMFSMQLTMTRLGIRSRVTGSSMTTLMTNGLTFLVLTHSQCRSPVYLM
jgi:hypothetical protein